MHSRKAPICTEHRPNAIASGNRVVPGCGEYGCRSPACWPAYCLDHGAGLRGSFIHFRFCAKPCAIVDRLGDRALLALFQVLARFPEGLGQIRFMRDRLLGRQARLIEYK